MVAKSSKPNPGIFNFNSRQGRVLLENITAYLFLLPAALIIFTFGIFPVAFAFFVSLHRWRRFPGDYEGLDSYVEAMGNLAYVAFFWLAIAVLLYAGLLLLRTLRDAHEHPRSLAYLIPGAALAAFVTSFVNWVFLLLPAVLNVPNRLRGTEINRESFLSEFFASFRFENVLIAHDQTWLIALIAGALVGGFLWGIRVPRSGHYLTMGTFVWLAAITGALLLQLTLNEINLAITEAVEEGENLPIWSQIIMISFGVMLLYLGYRTWQRAVAADDDRRFWLQGLATVLLLVGAVALIVELPQALAESDDDVLRGFNVTVMYSLFSVPLQLVLGLGLAVLLFQNIRGRAFFRVVYFLPYITPFVATSVVFALLFSHRSASPINTFIANFGLEPQSWLLEPQGIFELMFGDLWLSLTGVDMPEWAVGPGLALIVIILYNVWIYAGYSTVIFLAGLGNIPGELYEAARIDGANGWQQFRFVTLPLLSPTTFFLTLIATIGTFQAFTQIFLLRRPGAYDAVDTINLYIYQEIRTSNPDYAYGSAMAFVLFAVILMLTLFQNRIAERRVFYG